MKRFEVYFGGIFLGLFNADNQEKAFDQARDEDYFKSLDPDGEPTFMAVELTPARLGELRQEERQHWDDFERQCDQDWRDGL